MPYNSHCKACDHLHDGMICAWHVHHTGQMKLRPVYSDGLWGITAALHEHGVNNDNVPEVYKLFVDVYKQETFEYEQEIECGCRFYIPSNNLEFLEWKYEQSK